MALLTVHTFPDPVLKQKALPVDEFDEKLSELAENMLETCLLYTSPSPRDA